MSIIQGLSREQAAELLGTSTEFLVNCARRRTGPAFYKLSQKLVLYPRDELIAWMEQCRVPNAQPSETP